MTWPVFFPGIRRGWRYSLLLLAAGIGAACALPFHAVPADGQTVLDDPKAGLEEWARIESVLTHPRCLNCHTMTPHPTQGEERRPHALLVKRGPDGLGEGLKCRACHRAGNGAGVGVPGAEGWHMPPMELAWEKAPGEAASGEAICASLKHNGDDDGQPDFERLIEYSQLAGVVLWAWEPGKRPDGTERAKPPISHEAYVDAVKRWISAGAPCPPPPATGSLTPPPE